MEPCILSKIKNLVSLPLAELNKYKAMELLEARKKIARHVCQKEDRYYYDTSGKFRHISANCFRGRRGMRGRSSVSTLQPNTICKQIFDKS